MKKFFVYIGISAALIVLSVYTYKIFYAGEKKSVIKFSSWGSQSEAAVLKSVINDYEQNNPDVKIDFIHIPQNYFQKLHLLFASNLEPDVIFINNQNIKMYINAGLLEDLSPFFNDLEPEFFLEALNCFSKDGKLYAVPRDISNLVIYYNKDLLNEVKLTSLDDILKIGEKLKPKGVFAINSEENPIFWLYYLASSGGGVLSDDLKHIIINTPESLNALQFCSDLINKYHYAPSKSEIGSMTTAQMFINGKTAMYLGGRWMIPKFRETIKFNWDITEFPASDEHKLYIDSSGWAVSKKSKNKQTAIDFIAFLASKENAIKFASSGLIVPAGKSAAEKIILLENSQPPNNSAAFINMLSKSKPTPVTENYASINDILTETARSIFYSNKNPKDVLNEETIKKLEGLL